jgi:hypothetical protein
MQMQLPMSQWTNLGPGPLVLSAEVELFQWTVGTEPPDPPGVDPTNLGNFVIPGQGSQTVTTNGSQNIYVAPRRPGATVNYSTP